MNLLLAVVLALSLVTASTTQSPSTFSDVPKSNPYYDAILSLSDTGVMAPVTSTQFRPDARIAREDFAAAMCRAMGSNGGNWDCYSILRECSVTPWIMPAEAVGYISEAMVAGGLWTATGSGVAATGLAETAPWADELAIYLANAGPIPGTNAAGPEINWTFAAKRGWLAEALWTALGASTWTTPASARQMLGSGVAEDSVVTGTMNLTATFNSVGIEVFFTGDRNANATATVEFKASTATSWRSGLPLWRTDDGSATPGPAFYGSVLLLNAGATYDIRVSVADPDSVTGNKLITGQVTTRREDIAAASTLTPTHYVRANGDDANPGTRADAAWKTLEKAFAAAPAGAVVQVGPGSYAPPVSQRTSPLTIRAEFPAVNDAQQTINPGKHSIIEPQTFSSPAGSTAGVVTPWKEVTLRGPATGVNYKIWKWTGAPVTDATELGVAAKRTDAPIRMGYWKRPDKAYAGYTMTTPEGWTEVLRVNDTFNYGFTSFGADVYLRIPGDRNPNDFFVFLHNSSGTETGRTVVESANVRISGFEVRMIETLFQSNANFGVFDHNAVYNAEVYFRADPGEPSVSPTDGVVQYNRLSDSSLYSTNPDWPSIPWLFIKRDVEIKGKATGWRRVGDVAETTGIHGRGGMRRLVARFNTVEGYFNGIGAYNKDYDRYAKAEFDVYSNTFRYLADDAIEPDGKSINWRVWNNRIENTSIAVSIGPLQYGPLYFFRNQVWRLSNEGVGADSNGNQLVGANGFKYSGSSTPTARVYVIQNTFWTDKASANGGLQSAGGGSATESFCLRNNIFRMTQYVFKAPTQAWAWDEDYNLFYTSDAKRGIEYLGRHYTSMDEYRNAGTQGDHSNRGASANGFDQEPGLLNPASGDLQLAPDSPLIDAGAIIPNIADRPGIDYKGEAPDIGARELR